MILGKEVCSGPVLMISQIGGVYMYLSHVNDLTNLRWIPVSNDISVRSCIPVLPGLLIISQIGDVDMPYNISVNDTTNKRRVPALCYRLVELLTEYADAVVTQNTSTIATDNINLLVVNISDKGDQDFTYRPTLFDNKTEEVGLLSIDMLPESQ